MHHRRGEHTVNAFSAFAFKMSLLCAHVLHVRAFKRLDHCAGEVRSQQSLIEILPLKCSEEEEHEDNNKDCATHPRFKTEASLSRASVYLLHQHSWLPVLHLSHLLSCMRWRSDQEKAPAECVYCLAVMVPVRKDKTEENKNEKMLAGSWSSFVADVVPSLDRPPAAQGFTEIALFLHC